MVEQRKVNTSSRDEEDLETLASSSQTGHYSKPDYAFVSKKDAYADMIIDMYNRLQSDAYMPFKAAFFVATPVAVFLFTALISSSTSNVIAFTAFCNAISYIVFSLYMLGWILEKEIGPRSMQEVAEPIKEGSEGFFMTQYGTIFKLAFILSIGLFLIYNARDQVQGSELSVYFSI
jgi:hypothetical protein